MFGHPAYNYSKGKSAKSTGGFDQADGSPCKSREPSHHRAQLPDKLIIGLRSKVAPGDMGEERDRSMGNGDWIVGRSSRQEEPHFTSLVYKDLVLS